MREFHELLWSLRSQKWGWSQIHALVTQRGLTNWSLGAVKRHAQGACLCKRMWEEVTA